MPSSRLDRFCLERCVGARCTPHIPDRLKMPPSWHVLSFETFSCRDVSQVLTLPVEVPPGQELSPRYLWLLDEPITINFFDEVAVQTSGGLNVAEHVDTSKYKKTTGTGQMVITLERRFLGSLRIPFSTVFKARTLSGTMRIDVPANLVGYAQNPAGAPSANVFITLVSGYVHGRRLHHAGVRMIPRSAPFHHGEQPCRCAVRRCPAAPVTIFQLARLLARFRRTRQCRIRNRSSTSSGQERRGTCRSGLQT